MEDSIVDNYYTIFFGVFISFFCTRKKTQKIEINMSEELDKLKLPMNTKHYKTERSHKSDNALVFSNYYSDLKDDQIIDHYKKQLKRNGWRYCCNDDDQYNKELIFTKNDFTAHLHIKKERSKNTRAYELSIAWNLFNCNQCK